MERRARGLPALYRAKLSALDRQYHNIVEGEVGPLQERLESMGPLLRIGVGAFGDTSSDFGRVIRGLAESRALYQARQTGKPVTDAKTGKILGQYPRVFSTLFIWCQAMCLVERMGHLGAAAQECAARRRVTMAQEERLRKEAEAFFSAYIRGRG